MKYFVFLLILFLGMTPPTTTQAQTKPGAWRSLFDGQTLKGWRGYKQRDTRNWVVEQGVLHCKNTINDKAIRADLVTTEVFQDFELEWEWKIATGGNSGLMFRVTEEFDQPYFTGPEYQMVDDTNYPDLTVLQKTAANYDMHTPTAQAKPLGKWNTSRIVVRGQHVEHWLNGTKALEYELQSPDWQQRKDKSKWKTATQYGANPKGHIALQDHGSLVWVRKIRIREW